MKLYLMLAAGLAAGCLSLPEASAGFGDVRVFLPRSSVCVGGSCGVRSNVVVRNVPSQIIVQESRPEIVIQQQPSFRERIIIQQRSPSVVVRRGLFGRTIIRRGCR